MSGPMVAVLGAFVAVMAVLLVAVARLETGYAAILVVAFALYSGFVLLHAHRALERDRRGRR